MKKSTPLSVRVLHFLTQFSFWAITVLTAATLVFNTWITFTDVDLDAQLNIAMPFSFDVVETGTLTYDGIEKEVNISEAFGKIELVDTPYPITKIVARSLLIVLLFFLYMMHKARGFMKAIKKGDYFNPYNFLKLKQFASALFAFAIFYQGYFVYLGQFVLKDLQFESIKISYELREISGLLLTALIIWVISHVFQRGARMQRELDRTI